MTEIDDSLNIKTFDKTDGWLLAWLAVIFFCLYFLTASVLVRETGDGGLMYRDASVIYRDLSEGHVPGTGDIQLTKFSPGQPLLNIPTLFFHNRSLETTGTAKLFWILLISLLPVGLAVLCNLMVFSILRRLGVSQN